MSADDQAGGPTATLRLYLRATNLPKSLGKAQPDTFARISWLSEQAERQLSLSCTGLPPPMPAEAESIDESAFTDAGEGSEEASSHSRRQRPQDEHETEVVAKSSNPRWTASFPVRYEYGTQSLFFVDIYAVHGRNSSSGGGGGLRASFGGKFRKSSVGTTKHLGRAAFDVQDVLGSTKKVKARRLRRGGVVYAHLEQQSSSVDASSVPRSPLSTSSSTQGRVLNLRLRADSLVHTHSVLKSKVVPKNIQSKPDTYFEVSRPSSGAWIVVYRSPPVKESVSPTWDEAAIELTHPEESFRVKVTVYKVKKRKCKEIGAFETTVEALMDACRTRATITGVEGEYPTEESPDFREEKPFQLRPTPTGAAGPSDIVTGNIKVVEASIEDLDEAWKTSRRFLSDVDETDTDSNSLCGMRDDDSNAAYNPALAPHPRPKFSDYVRAGILSIDFCVAVDFTSSNGDPRVPGTQHYSRDGMMNDYEEAILALGTTIEKYSSSKEYPVWGFGAKYGGAVRHIFQCGGSPTARGTEGVLDAYRAVFETDLIMSGPTEISSVLRAAAARSKRFYNASPTTEDDLPQQQYCVLLILTDGIVNDLQSMQNLLHSYRELRLPLSVIVVGIGRADFTEFHRLNDALAGFRFVEFREHQFDPDKLSSTALTSVPREVVDNFVQRNIMLPPI